jgi:predicted nucleotidyltransferase
LFLPDARVLLIGSRARGGAKPFSDVDLLFTCPPSIDPVTRARLHAAFEDSNLPYNVDLLEWDALAPSFRERLLEGAEILMPTPTN